ncbi:MAG TPA: ATP-dependent helicase [Candidatus Fusicatenibacter merdavium]|uniref:DNA 3'-5' helicase n=1 Tax=Candidatus Fusicatenibacter merdavium TaxID=2838600 RepID=A0A9D2BI04_9FIRM|nr:ATP-dependent helicase [Candidatus Fusicatenibacter merdavium]
MEYNHSQRQAVEHVAGPMMVLAGPGSGKTAVITGRTCRLVERGVPAEAILVVTFTKAAAREMKERYLKRMNRPSTRVTFGTFHGVFYGILRNAYRLSGQNILSEEQKLRLLRELVHTYCRDAEEEEELIANLNREIGTVKNNRIELEHFYSTACPEEVFRTIYRAYEKWKRDSRKLDFDDIMVWCYELFRKHPEILALWQKKFQYILIDEFQDINPIQYDIVRMLAKPQDNLFIVGDDDQSIYRFRGARPEIMLHFPEDYPNAETVTLDINYRSSGAIVRQAGKLIANNEKRFPKTIKASHGQGEAVALREYETVKDELQDVTDGIRACVSEGTPYEEIALLFRTNAGSRMAVEQLIADNIPFQMRDRLPNLYDHWISRDILTYLRIGLGSRRRADFLQICNRPNRYLARDAFEAAQVSFEALYEYYEGKDWMCRRIEKLEQDLQLLGRMTPFGAVNYIRFAMGYEEYLKEYASYRRMKPEEFLERLDELQELSRGYRTAEDWFRHIEEYRETLAEEAKKNQQEKSGVTISTLHSVKGLEYDCVYILDVNEGVMPYQKAVLEEDIEEERRMFYVGMTRARKKLTLCSVKERFDKKTEPSRFLEEILM